MPKDKTNNKKKENEPKEEKPEEKPIEEPKPVSQLEKDFNCLIDIRDEMVREGINDISQLGVKIEQLRKRLVEEEGIVKE